jgi:PTS system mannose-specific IID component
MAAALAPVLARDPDPERRRRRARRYLGSYNTHPALAGPLLGALARLEETGNTGDEAALREAERYHRALEAPFAARGDAFFWGALRPLAIFLGGLGSWAAGPAGLFLLLAVYNAVHLGVRVGGVAWGYAVPERVPGLVRAAWLRRGPAPLRLLAFLAAFALVVLILGSATRGGSGAGPVAVCVLSMALAWAGERRRFVRGGLGAGFVIMFGLILAYCFGRGEP